MRRVVLLTGRHRAPSINRVLGLILAFNAGAINAGGFLVVHMYTSHMTGFVSTLADNLVLGNMLTVLAATGALIAFLSGAAATALIVNWAKQHQLRSGFAIPLLLEALLMLVFGLVGAVTLETRTPFAVPLTVLLLSFLMGLQNAVVSKMSGSQIRTTHMTGVVTDLGMELGKLLYWNRSGTHANAHVHANKARLRLYASLLMVFFVGGLAGATAFKRVGFVWVLPLAFVLLAVSLPPLVQDFKRSPSLQDLAKRIVAGFKRL